MTPNPPQRRIGELLRGDRDQLRAWVERWDTHQIGFSLTIIIVGAGLYGAAMGCWRAPLQALFVAVKFPLIIFLTTLGNALLNAMLAPLLGLNLTLRQSIMAVLLSFTIASAILGSFSPLAAFVVWNVPAMTPDVRISDGTYNVILLLHVFVIALAGVTANLRLAQLLGSLSRQTTIARRVLFAWLAGNLFLGSQLSWLLRPFVGSPGMPVEFLRKNAFQGNFYETVFQSALGLIKSL